MICSEVKPLCEFYAHKGMTDGHLNKCKECTKKYISSHRRDNEHVRERDREKYHRSQERRESIQFTANNWRNKNPEARKAHNAVARAKRNGKLIPLPCEVCGSIYRIHAHHDDYAKPLEVKWLCAKHHIRLHNN